MTNTLRETLMVYLYTVGNVPLVEATIVLRGLVATSKHPDIWNAVVDELSDMMEAKFGLGRKPLSHILYEVVDRHTRF